MKKILFLLLCTVTMYGQTYQNPTFGTVTSKTNVEDNSAKKIIVQDANGKLNWIYKNSLTPDNYTKVVYVNNNNPNGATIFDLNNPPTVNGNLLKADVNNLYIGLDASTWVYNATSLNYVTKTITSATSNFYLSGTTTDAGNSKTANIERFGNVRVNTGSLNTNNVARLPDAAIEFSNTSTTINPTLTAKSTTGGFRFIAATNDINPVVDINFDVRETDDTDFATITSPAFTFSRFATTLFTISRNGSFGYGGASDSSVKHRFYASATDAYSTSFSTAPSQTSINNSSMTNNSFSMIRLSTNNANNQSGQTYLGTVNTAVNFESIFVIGRRTATSTWSESLRIHPTGGMSIGNTTDLGAATLNVAGNISTIAATTANHAVIKSQLDLKANLASPTFTGNPTAPTPTAGDNDTTIPNTEFVTRAIATAKPYKVYVALITQTGTSAPTAIVLENTLGGAISWSYLGIGSYSTFMPMMITQSKTTVQLTNGLSNANVLRGGFRNANEVQIVSTSDGSFTNAFIEIRVYP